MIGPNFRTEGHWSTAAALTGKPVRVRVSPSTLSAAQLAAIEGVGLRLRSELARLIRALPSDSRSVRTMASLLDVDRNTCQRVISATQPDVSGCEAFVRLPGLKPLRQIVAHAQKRGVGADCIESLTVALDRLDSVLEEFNESHVRLKARIEASLSAGAPALNRGELDIRRSLFEEHSRLLQRQIRIHSLITAVGPHADDPTKLEQAWVRALLGLRMGKGAAPLPLGIATTDREHHPTAPAPTFDPLSRRAAPGARNAGIVPALSSTPLPTLTTRGPAGSQVSVIDPATTDPEREIDVTVATRASHVAHPGNEMYHTSAVMLTPTARMIFDVYLHRSLAMSSVPACGVFQYTMSFSSDMDENWPFRLPGQYRLELLGSGLQNAGSDAWDRHADAAAHLFSQTGWSPEDYIGHRLQVEFPMWGSTICQWFDFRTATPQCV